MKDKSLGLFIQSVLFISLFITLTMSLFINELMFVSETILGLTLIVVGINNKLTYKRKYMTTIYIIFGILSIVLTIYYGFVNGI